MTRALQDRNYPPTSDRTRRLDGVARGLGLIAAVLILGLFVYGVLRLTTSALSELWSAIAITLHP